MRKLFLLCLIAFLLVFIISCSEPSGSSADPEPGDIIEVNDGTFSQSLSGLKPGQKLYFKIGPTGKLNLSGVTIDSLFSVESKGSASRSVSRSDNEQLSRVTDDFGEAYIMLPQEDGEVSFEGLDVGVSGDEDIVVVEKAGDGLTEGKNYVEFQIFPTIKDYRESGEPEYMWPTYQNYINLDFTSGQWSKYAGQKIVIVQYGIHKSDGPCGGILQGGRLGLVENEDVVYSNEIKGLYDLSGKDSLHLYTYLRTPWYNGDNEFFRVYLLIPEKLSETPFEIVDYPHVFKIDPQSGDPYEIRITGISREYFTDFLVNTASGNPRYTGEGGKENGKRVEEPIWVREIVNNGDGTYNLVLYFEGVDAQFIMDSSWWDDVEPGTVFGSISLKHLNETWSPGANISLTDFEAHNVTVGGSNPIAYTIPLATDASSYTLTLTSSSSSVCYFRRIGGWGNNTLEKGSEPGTYSAEVSLHPNDTGYITVYSLNGEATFSYQLTKK